jgi:hypothetical protein
MWPIIIVLLVIITTIIIVIVERNKKVSGCTDTTADNYNPQATEDDGSCTYPPPVVSGCTDTTADNYNPQATEDDGSCTYPPPVVSGCKDTAADNYNPQATEDDGSCTYGITCELTPPTYNDWNNSCDEYHDPDCFPYVYRPPDGCEGESCNDVDAFGNCPTVLQAGEECTPSCRGPLSGRVLVNKFKCNEDGTVTKPVCRSLRLTSRVNNGRVGVDNIDDIESGIDVIESTADNIEGCRVIAQNNNKNTFSYDPDQDKQCRIFNLTPQSRLWKNQSQYKSWEWWGDNYTYSQKGIIQCTDPTLTKGIYNNKNCLQDFEVGCTDPDATNYYPYNTNDDGSCEY